MMALNFLWTFPYDAIKYTFYTSFIVSHKEEKSMSFYIFLTKGSGLCMMLDKVKGSTYGYQFDLFFIID
jgi:hypothetical protein